MSTATSAPLSTIGALVALLLGTAVSNPAETLEMSLEILTEEITLHEPVFLEVALVNSGSTPVQVDLGIDGVGNYRFALVDSEGKRLEGAVLSGEGFHFEDAVTLDAGGQHKRRLLLDRWIHVEEAGHYRLEGWFSGGVTSAEGRQLPPPKAQSLAFEVLPRSEDRLAETCRQLALTAIRLQDMDQSLTAAEALSRVGDPIAVPALDQVLRSGFLPTQNLAVQGLKRIGNKAAVEALSDALHQGDLIGREARSALEGLRRRETEPELLKIIDEALQSVQ